jgi:transposase
MGAPRGMQASLAMMAGSGAILAGVAAAEPTRVWFGQGGCVVEQHDDGTRAVFVRGQLLCAYTDDDVAGRDVLIAVVRDQGTREDLARAFRVSEATVGRVITRFNGGGFQAVADYGRHGGRSVRTPQLERRLAELFEKGLGPRAAHAAAAKKASYGTVFAIHKEWRARRASPLAEVPAPQPELPLGTLEARSPTEDVPPSGPAQVAAAPAEPPLEAIVPAGNALIQHAGAWMLLGIDRLDGCYNETPYLRVRVED